MPLVYARTKTGKVVHLVYHSAGHWSSWALCGRRMRGLKARKPGKLPICEGCAVKQAENSARAEN